MTYQMTVAGSFPRSSLYNLQFPGQYYDAETGHNYNYFRDYDPAIGRYTKEWGQVLKEWGQVLYLNMAEPRLGMWPAPYA